MRRLCGAVGSPEEEQDGGEQAEEWGGGSGVEVAVWVVGGGRDFGDGVDGGYGVLRGAVEGDAGGEERACGVLAGIDGGAVEDYGSAEDALGG